MKVFISWSGVPSRELADALHWWLPKVIQGIEPFVSAKDIDKGANWTSVIAKELETTQFGIICTTPENLASAWLNYEAGAISKAVEARVCPLLLGLKPDDVGGPLAQMQLTSLNFDDILLMLRSINRSAGGQLTESDLKEAAEMWWPRLEERIKAIAVPAAGGVPVDRTEPIKPEASEAEMLQEVLEAVRRLDKRLFAMMDGQRSRVALSANDGGHSASLQQLVASLRALGLDPIKSTTAKDGLTIRVAVLPKEMPSPVAALLSDTAIARNERITLTDTGSGPLFGFEPDGEAWESPF